MNDKENRVLYIDDEEVNLLLFEATFSKNYNVTTVNSTKAAEVLMAQMQFKVVISDISMPDENGLDFFKRLQPTEISPIFIILTAHISNSLLLEALNQGHIYKYITKPWNIEEVQFTINNAIQLYDLHYQNYVLYQQIKQSQQNFQNIFQSSLDGIVILNSDRVIVQVNKSFSDNLGVVDPIDVGVKLTDYIPEATHIGYWESISNLEHLLYTSTEFEFYPALDVKRIFEVKNSKIEYKGEWVIMSMFRDITERRLNEKKILNAVIHAEEKERSRLAKDIHDGLGPIMATLKMYLEWLNDQQRVSDHPDIIKLSLNSINEAIVTLKSISNNLSPHILEKFGLVAALTAYIERVKKVLSIQFNLTFNLTSRFALAAEMSLYRVITECINNTIRHSGASNIALDLWNDNNVVYFLYSDDGKGFDLTQAENLNGGMGLHNMRNRIKTMGGKITIVSKPGEGIKVETIVPLN